MSEWQVLVFIALVVALSFVFYHFAPLFTLFRVF